MFEVTADAMVWTLVVVAIAFGAVFAIPEIVDRLRKAKHTTGRHDS